MRPKPIVLLLALLSLVLMFSMLSREMAAQGNPSEVGRWSFFPDLTFFPPHVHVLPTGKVMMWPGDVGAAGGASGNDVRSWDPITGATALLAAPGYDPFCAGHVFLADGRLFAAGGHIQTSVGLPYASTYDPFNDLWTSVPPMSAGRWYPTATLLGNGDVLVVSGDTDGIVGQNLLPSVFEVQSDTWRDLTSAPLFLDLYPRMHLAPDGRVFNSAPSEISRSLDTSGTGAWSVVAHHAVDAYRDYGSSVAYGDGKILVAGGGDPPTATAEVIDLNDSNAAWRQVGSMAFPRRQLGASVLPDGKVLVTGGTSGPGFNNVETPVFAAEMWDPSTENWTTMASARIPRLYHSTLVLLPDARLLSTGGNNTTQVEIYEPPYLFAGPRPTIGSVPGSVGHEQTFFVETTDAASITQVSLISLPSVTHAFDHNQRFNRLTFSRVTGGLNVVAPSANLAPPGPYMLFILQGNDVPSVAKIVRIASASETGPTLSSLSPHSAAVGGPSFTMTIHGSGFVSGSLVQWNGMARPTAFASGTRLTATIPAGDLAAAATAQVTVRDPGGMTSNALAFPINSFTVSPATMVTGGTITAAWSGLSEATATDWIALYSPDAPDSAYLSWMYVSCSKTSGSPRSSGSCPFAVPASLPFGGYELRLFANGTFERRLLTSNVFTVASSATLAVSPASVAPGGTVTATWSGIVEPTAEDWIALHVAGGPNRQYFAWIYVSCSKAADTPRTSGSCPFTVPSTVPPGNYNLRLFANGDFNPLAASGSLAVGAPAPGSPTLTVSPATIAPGGTVTATWSGIAAPTAADWMALYAPGAADTAFITWMHVSCSKTPGDSAAAGSCPLVVPATLPAGTYQMRLFANGVYSLLTTSNSFTVAASAGPTLTVSPATIAPGGTVTATWSGIAAPTAADWMALYAPGAADTAFITWMHVSCSKTPGASAAAGSCPLVVPATLPAGTYQMRLFANGVYSLLTTSNSFTVAASAGPTLTVSPATIAPGGTVTAAWSGIAAPTAADWMALYAPGAADTAFITWMHVSCSKTPGGSAAAGSCPLVVPATLPAGTYQMRLFANGVYSLLTTSNSFTVIASAGPTLTVSPATIAPGGTVTAAWSGIAEPTAADWMALYAPGAADTAFITWMHVSCSKIPGDSAAAGSCPLVVPATVPAGTYQMRLFANGVYSLLTTSNSFTVTAPAGPTLTVTPAAIAAGGTVTAAWSGIAAPTAADWMALYASGAADTAFITWMHVSCSKTPGDSAAAGSCPLVVPATLPAGTYQMRLFANGVYSLLDVSNSFTVQ
jgi:hypothetical protein